MREKSYMFRKDLGVFVWFLFVCFVHSKALCLNIVTGAPIETPSKNLFGWTLFLQEVLPCHREPSVPDFNSFLVSLGNRFHFTHLLELKHISLKFLVWKKIAKLIKCSSSHIISHYNPRLLLTSIVPYMPDQKAARLSGPSYKNSITNSFSLNWS